MKIIILNGNPFNGESLFDNYLEQLSSLLRAKDNTVALLKLIEMDIRLCTGCWGCWVKTPGRCHIKDGSDEICREYINADFALFASPVIMGFTSALLKKAHEKLLPLIHPYFELVDGEVHHASRYEKYPLMGLLLQKAQDTDDEDIDIITDIYRRDAINFKSRLCFTRLISEPVEEVADEINGIQRVSAGTVE